MIGRIERTMGLMLISALAFAGVASAGNGAVSLAPSVVMLRGEAGQSTTQTLTFMNGTSQPFSFEMMAKDVVVRDGKRQFAAAGALPGSIAATAVFSPKQSTMLPGQSVDINVTVTIPARPAARAIVIMCHSTTRFGTGPMQMTASVGTLMTFAIVGDVIAAEASPLIVRAPTPSANFAASQQVSNSGTAPVVATGMLAILDAAGALAGKQAIPQWRMLPGEKTDVRVDYGGELRPGRYRALITYDLTVKTLNSSAEFNVR
ncbi:MAG: hypothetical protein QOC81_2578 [Thermoanaerobaculia bacterium]|jgi:hypothetical protein|nr:hypothetical protein [Thermoanaerobaculia bacterium]